MSADDVVRGRWFVGLDEDGRILRWWPGQDTDGTLLGAARVIAVVPEACVTAMRRERQEIIDDLGRLLRAERCTRVTANDPDGSYVAGRAAGLTTAIEALTGEDHRNRQREHRDPC